MATGILAIASRVAGIDPLSIALFAIAAAAYVLLSAIGALRLLRASRPAWAWLRSSEVGFGAFTFVAASGVLGAWLAGEGKLASDIAIGLWAVTATSWLVLCSGFASGLVHRGSTEARFLLTGAPFLTVVATQSLAALSVALADRWHGDPLALAAFCAWLLGIAVYLVLVGRLALRLVQRPAAAWRPSPDIWIVMGALAITTLAGTDLASPLRGVGLPSWMHSITVGLTASCWAAATLLIPFLIGAELWKATRTGPALGYDARRWSTVFPLGMYATASYRLGHLAGLAGPRLLGEVFLVLALAAWALVTLQLSQRGIGRGRPRVASGL
jgi:tellurite resistance protein TehA-like permease